jgi:hypothetical protein
VVKAYFDRFPVEHAVAAIDPLPHADETQLRSGDGRFRAEAVQVLVRDKAGMAAERGVRGGAALEVICRS